MRGRGAALKILGAGKHLDKQPDARPKDQRSLGTLLSRPALLCDIAPSWKGNYAEANGDRPKAEHQRPNFLACAWMCTTSQFRLLPSRLTRLPDRANIPQVDLE